MNVLKFLPFFFLAQAKPLFACSVCFGNPDSLQSKGIATGVLFLIVITGGVLTLIAATAYKWSRRAKLLEEIKMAAPERSRHFVK